MTESQSARDALDAFLHACGVTVPVMEAPQDRFAEAAPVTPSSAPPFREDRGPRARREPRPSPPPESVPAPVGDVAPADADAVHAAREVARSATSLTVLRQALAAFDGVPLKATALSTCHGEGPEGAPVMFVGEAPGREEDEAGRPFVGRSGRLLERMLAAIGFSRDEVFISNVIPWRPPGNRTPGPIETATCEVFVRREIELVAPKILVPLGGAAAKTLLRTDAGIMRQRGRWERFVPGEAAGGAAIDAMATLHPAYLLRQPAEKAKAWRDLLAIRRRLEEAHGLPPMA